MFKNKGQKHDYITRSGSFGTHGSAKGYVDCNVRVDDHIDQLLDNTEKIKLYTERLMLLQKEISDARVKHSFHKSRSLVDQIKKRCQKKGFISPTYEHLLRMTDEIRDLTKKITDLKVGEKCFRPYHFLEAAKTILDEKTIVEISEKAQRLFAAERIKQ